MGRGEGELLKTTPNVSRGTAPILVSRRRISPYVVRDDNGSAKYGGALLKIDGEYYLAAKCSLNGVEMPAITVKGERVYPIKPDPRFAHIIASYWHLLGVSTLARIYSVADLAADLKRVGLDRKSVGGRDDKPLDDPTTRFWFREVRHQMLLPLTNLASEDDRRPDMGCARSGEQLTAAIQQREGRIRRAAGAFKGAERLLENYEKTGDWSSWRSAIAKSDWSNADKAVANELIRAMDRERLKAAQLAEIAAAADPANRRWRDESIRELINRMRAEGVPIAATSGRPAGMWIEDDPADYRKWLDGFKRRHKAINDGTMDLKAAKALWFPKDEAAREKRDRRLAEGGVLAPLEPSPEAIKRINRVHETEARRRKGAADRKKVRMENARAERDRLMADPEFRAAFHLIETCGMPGTPKQQELVERFHRLSELAKKGRVPGRQRKSGQGRRRRSNGGGSKPKQSRKTRYRQKSISDGDLKDLPRPF